MVTYTGGICGTFILMLFPVTLVFYGRYNKFGNGKENFNASPFQNIGWIVLVTIFAFLTLIFVFIGIVTGTAGE